MGFQGAIFDLDGTLFDSMYVWSQIDIDFLGKRGFDVPEDYLERILVLGSLDAANYTIERFDLNEKPEDILAEWLSMAAHEYGQRVSLKPGAAEYLQYLKKKKIPIAVATSAEEELFLPAFENLQLSGIFQAVVTTKEAKAGKDKADVYLLAAEKLGLSSKDCVVFEDIYIGLLSAKKAGFFTVAIEEATSLKDRAALMEEAGCYVKDFHDLLTRPSLF